MNKNRYVCAISASGTKIAPVRSALAEESERLLAATPVEAGGLIYMLLNWDKNVLKILTI